MIITEGIVGDTDPTEANSMAEDHIKAHNTEEGVNKVITGANVKATMDSFTTLMETIIITITVVITEAHMDVATEVLIIDLTVTDGAITEAIIIISTNSIIHMMMGHK